MTKSDGFDDRNSADAHKNRNRSTDRNVGARVKQRRLALGITVAALAKEVGITEQQIFDCETGLSRIETPRLIQIARFLQGRVSVRIG